MPSNGEIIKDVVDQFQKVQAHMKNAKEEITKLDKIVNQNIFPL